MRVPKAVKFVIPLMALLSFAAVACQARLSPKPIATPAPEPKSYSDTVTVDPGVDLEITITVEALNRIVGSINVRPLDAFVDMRFRIKDPFGNPVLNLEEVKGERSFAIIAAASGVYRLQFANSHDRVQRREVSYSIKIYHR